ncbi:MAG TPA: hypothetical protein VGD63_10215 [Steroidobacteraceae bacterium]
MLDRADGDLSDANIEATLARLGDPYRLARANLQMRASWDFDAESYRPSNARKIADLIVKGIESSLALMVSILGYGFAASWLFTAILKPIAPSRVGLWALPDPTGDLSLSLGRRGTNVVGHDVFGWWIIPIGLAIGIGVGLLTYRFNTHVVRKSMQNRSIPPQSPM